MKPVVRGSHCPRFLLAAIVLIAALPVAADRGLAGCPDLSPVEPDLGGKTSCPAALLRASRRFERVALAGIQECLARYQRGGVPPDDLLGPTGGCLGQRNLFDGQRIGPSDPSAAAALERAETAARREIEDACRTRDLRRVTGCVDGDRDAERCWLDAQFDHLPFVVDAEVGALAADEVAAASGCQEGVARAARRYARRVHGAMGRCLARAARRDVAHAARRCLGKWRDGERVSPKDADTARRLAAARRDLEGDLADACDDTDLTALDVCGSDVDSAAACLTCTHDREALYAIGDAVGGRVRHGETGFIDWGALRNPILEEPDRMLKDQSLVWRPEDGRFYLFTSARFEPDDPEAGTKPLWFYRSDDLRTWERFSDPDFCCPGSPDVVRDGDLWRMTFQRRDPDDPDLSRLNATTSPDLSDWAAPAPIDAALDPARSRIDGATARAGDRVVLVYKWRQQQTTWVTRSPGPDLDGRWEAPQPVEAGHPDSFYYGFAENYQLVPVDGAWRVVATGREEDQGIVRCLNIVYVCSHEPYIYDLPGAGTQLADWTRWIHRRRLRIPYEAWNPMMHANTGYLSDWREHDGFFYLSYSGSDDMKSFEDRSHGKIGIARSRDLLHWRVPGDLRD